MGEIVEFETLKDKKFYNITFNADYMKERLVPKIPYTVASEYGENTTIKRVCLSTSIEHCIEAVAPSERELTVGRIIYVHEVSGSELNRKMLLKPEYLVKKGYVKDALETDEHWYLKAVNVKCYTYMIEDFECWHDIAWTCIDLGSVMSIAREIGELPVGASEATSAYELYNMCCAKYNEDEQYDLEDEIWDRVAELPWSRKVTVKKLKLKLVKEGI